jgi:hypothetical protein
MLKYKKQGLLKRALSITLLVYWIFSTVYVINESSDSKYTPFNPSEMSVTYKYKLANEQERNVYNDLQIERLTTCKNKYATKQERKENCVVYELFLDSDNIYIKHPFLFGYLLLYLGIPCALILGSWILVYSTSMLGRWVLLGNEQQNNEKILPHQNISKYIDMKRRNTPRKSRIKSVSKPNANSFFERVSGDIYLIIMLLLLALCLDLFNLGERLTGNSWVFFMPSLLLTVYYLVPSLLLRRTIFKKPIPKLFTFVVLFTLSMGWIILMAAVTDSDEPYKPSLLFVLNLLVSYKILRYQETIELTSK